jgi:hypothetical protein
VSTANISSGLIQVQVIPVTVGASDDSLRKLPDGSEQVARRGMAEALYDAVSSEDIERAIAQVCDAVASALEKVRPESCSVEFSMGFKAGVKIPVLVNGEANATFKITLNWKKPVTPS